MDEIKGKWQVFLVDSCGEKQDAISATTSFYGAMALIRGYLQRCEYADFVGGMVPVPFLVDQPTEPRPAKPLPAIVAVGAPRFESMVGPDLTFTRSYPSSAHVDQVGEVEAVNQELSQEADFSTASNY